MNYEKLLAETNAPTGKVIGRPFPKGVSGNPSGRPPKSLYQKRLEQELNDPEVVEQLVTATKQRLLSKGMAGVLEMRQCQERVDGPVKQEIEISGVLAMSTDEDIDAAFRRLLGL